jgi:hypothetical protein
MNYKRKKGKSISKAKKYFYNGQEYKSGLEVYMAKVLTENKIKFEYESKKFILQEGFHFDLESWERQANSKGEFKDRGDTKVREISYTPDFVGDGFIIETKGYANESFPMKYKMFKKSISGEEGLSIYKPQIKAECDLVIKLILKQKK